MMNKLWSVSSMLYNEDFSDPQTAYDYSLTVQDEAGNDVVLWDTGNFVFLMVTKFTSFCYLTPRFYDPESEQVVDIAGDINEAINLFHMTFEAWYASRQPAIERLFQAFRAKYNPIWNVDGVEGHIRQSSHTGDVTKTGKSETTNTGQTDTTHTGQTDTTNSGSSSNERNGNETNAPAGTETATTAKTTFDDTDFEDTQKITTGFSLDRIDTHTYNQVKDTYAVDPLDPLKETYKIDAQNPLKDQYKIDAQNPLKETYKIDDQNPLKEARNLSDQDLEMTIRQGNIGVTKSQDLVMSEKDVRDMDDIINYAIYDFVHRNLVLR